MQHMPVHAYNRAPMSKSKSGAGNAQIVANRKARHEYHLDENFEAAEKANPSPIKALMAALTAVGGRTRTRAEVANNLVMLNLDITDDELGRFAAEQSRVLRRRIVGLLEAANLGTAGQRERWADDLYVVWSGAAPTVRTNDISSRTARSARTPWMVGTISSQAELRSCQGLRA